MFLKLRKILKYGHSAFSETLPAGFCFFNYCCLKLFTSTSVKLVLAKYCYKNYRPAIIFYLTRHNIAYHILVSFSVLVIINEIHSEKLTIFSWKRDCTSVQRTPGSLKKQFHLDRAINWVHFLNINLCLST